MRTFVWLERDAVALCFQDLNWKPTDHEGRLLDQVTEWVETYRGEDISEPVIEVRPFRLHTVQASTMLILSLLDSLSAQKRSISVSLLQRIEEGCFRKEDFLRDPPKGYFTGDPDGM